jgi:biotin carboxylase
MKCCVIVDGCSTGQYLAPILKRKGYKCIHVQSHPKAYEIEHGGANPRDYMVSYVYDGNFKKLVSFLEEYQPQFIIPGSEPGVELANDLANRLNLFPNAPDSGKICRNKYLTHETLKKAGLPHIKQYLAKSLHSALSWAKEHNKWPIVIKPVSSGGGDGFFICHDEEDLCHNFQLVLGNANIFDTINTEVLLQECIYGEEYAVNTVTFDSRHYIESIMREKKIRLSDGRLIYESCSLVSQQDIPQLPSLKAYIFNVVNALGIHHGACHSEIMLTREGPVLIECAARLMGGSLPPDILSSCLGTNQVELLVKAYVNPKNFIKKYANKSYNLKKSLIIAYLRSKIGGKLKSINFLEKLRKLPSMADLRFYSHPGQYIRKTIDLPTAAGDAFLINSDPKQLLKDYKILREQERKGMFNVIKERVFGHVHP